MICRCDQVNYSHLQKHDVFVKDPLVSNCAFFLSDGQIESVKAFIETTKVYSGRLDMREEAMNLPDEVEALEAVEAVEETELEAEESTATVEAEEG